MNHQMAGLVSIVLNIHREGAFLPTTLRSLDAAVIDIKSRGTKVELIAVLDNADAITREALTAYSLKHYDTVKILEVSSGSLGLSRNDGLRTATGEYIFLADADDLISANYLSATLALAKQSSVRTLFFPEFLFAFGDHYHIAHYSDLDRVGVPAFLKHHPYISRVCAHRSLFDEIMFYDMRLSEGHAYEDWHFNCQAVAAGYDIKVVPDIVLFYRQRIGSLLRSADAISARQIAASDLFKPSIFLKSVDSKKSDAVAAPLANSWVEFRDSILDRENIKLALTQAKTLDKTIDISLFRGVPMSANWQHSDVVGQVYSDVARVIGDTVYADIFFLPFLSKGGAEKFVMQIIAAASRLSPVSDILVICGENYSGLSAEYDLPPNVNVLNLSLLQPDLVMEDRCLIALKAVERNPSSTRMHFLSSIFAVSMIERFGKLLAPYRCFYYRFNNDEKIVDKKLVVTYSPLKFISTYINVFETIVCDSEVMLRRDTEELPSHKDKWRLLHAFVPGRANSETPRNQHVTDVSVVKRSQVTERIEGGTSLPKHRLNVLWASRFDKQKRPELLPLIAAQIHDQGLPINIDAFGFSVFDAQSASQPDETTGLRYCGPFGRFLDLPLERYDVFLYTSWNDGVPNVILEAGAAELPVIAPDVGGISEVIQHESTGLLLASLYQDEDMARSYVQALRRFLEDAALGARLSSGFSGLLEQSFSQSRHEAQAKEIFGLEEVRVAPAVLAEKYADFAVRLRRNYVLEKEWLQRRNLAADRGSSSWPDQWGAPNYSRAHAIAGRYIRFADGQSPLAKLLRRVKRVLQPVWRRLRS